MGWWELLMKTLILISIWRQPSEKVELIAAVFDLKPQKLKFTGNKKKFNLALFRIVIYYAFLRADWNCLPSCNKQPLVILKNNTNAQPTTNGTHLCVKIWKGNRKFSQAYMSWWLSYKITTPTIHKCFWPRSVHRICKELQTSVDLLDRVGKLLY